MTIKKAVALLLAVMLLAASTAFAANYTEGRSNGGTQGTCTCSGSITLSNGTRDSVKGTTTSGAKGKVSVIAKIYWSNGETTVNRSKSSNIKDTYTASATVYADNQYATSGLATHAYTSEDYGTWYGTTSKEY